ncbi:hypothetical protein [Xanthomonas euvesicatoria]|uniref:hypothetical protein n=1 Tax=Xanthomonas euvesicatoria TaxID=456327 RepID=UPI001C45175B|nr:hypothetical protein [Xanthomonas euvesicatoria]MBV6840148.1 hypothetical protein [Xanthomonas campestris pv. fici]
MERSPFAIDRTMLARHLPAAPHWLLHPPCAHYVCGFGDGDFAEAARVGNDHLIPRSLTLCFGAPRGGLPIAPGDYLHCLLRALARAAALFDEDREVLYIVLGEGLPELVGCGGVARLLNAIPQSLRTVARADVAVLLRPGSPLAVRSLVAAGCTRGVLLDDGTASAASRLAAREAIAGAGFAATGHVLAGYPDALRVEEVLAWRPDRLGLAWLAAVGPTLPCLLADAVQRLGEAGYAPAGADTFAMASSPPWRCSSRAQYCDLTGTVRAERTDLIGIGAGAESQLGEVFCQAIGDPARWCAAVAAGRLGIERGLVQSQDEAMRAEIMQSLACDYRLDTRAAECADAMRFHDDVAPVLARLQPLVEQGLARWNGQVLSLSFTGALLWRIFVACFQHPASAP